MKTLNENTLGIENWKYNIKNNFFIHVNFFCIYKLPHLSYLSKRKNHLNVHSSIFRGRKISTLHTEGYLIHIKSDLTEVAVGWQGNTCMKSFMGEATIYSVVTTTKYGLVCYILVLGEYQLLNTPAGTSIESLKKISY